MTGLYIGREKEPERLAVIINTLPNNLGPENEFGNIGEVWERYGSGQHGKMNRLYHCMKKFFQTADLGYGQVLYITNII